MDAENANNNVESAKAFSKVLLSGNTDITARIAPNPSTITPITGRTFSTVVEIFPAAPKITIAAENASKTMDNAVALTNTLSRGNTDMRLSIVPNPTTTSNMGAILRSTVVEILPAAPKITIDAENANNISDNADAFINTLSNGNIDITDNIAPNPATTNNIELKFRSTVVEILPAAPKITIDAENVKRTIDNAVALANTFLSGNMDINPIIPPKATTTPSIGFIAVCALSIEFFAKLKIRIAPVKLTTNRDKAPTLANADFEST